MPSQLPRLFALGMAAAIVTIIVCANLGVADAAFDFFQRVPGADVTWHVVLYLLLSLAVISWRMARTQNDAVGRTLLFLAVLVGLEELSQRWIPGRTFSLVDLAASFAGLLAGALVARFGLRWIRPRGDRSG